LSDQFTIEYVELPNGRAPARDFVDSLDDKAAARIDAFIVLFFYQPGMLIVITSGFQKKTEQTPPGEITRAEQLKKLWMKYRNRYAGSQKEREAILKELGL
jgi:hypothetical protein